MDPNQPEPETLLEGGNVNSEVVRIGNSVRRAMGPQSPTIHKLLAHLEARGFTASPRFLGIDEKGREILTFIEGESEFPDQLWQRDEPLVAAAKLLRAYHDATEDFEDTASHKWAFSYPDRTLHEVICHNDFAPYNMIFNDGNPQSIIDFDLAGPGPRLRDVAYLAYWMVPLSFHGEDMKPHAQSDLANGSARLKLFCATYDIPCDRALLQMVAEVLHHMSDEATMEETLGKEGAERLKNGGHLEHWRLEELAFTAQLDRVAANLNAA